MPETRRVEHNNNAAQNNRSSSDGAAGRQKKPSGALMIDFGGGQYPDRPGEPNCAHYVKTGVCGYGSNCRFNHPAKFELGVVYGAVGEFPEREGEPDCEFFIKNGTCKYRSSCRYNHPKDRNGAGPLFFNSLGLPMRSEEKQCLYYMRTGECKFGKACKFHHPQPAVPKPVLPVNGLVAFESAGSSTVPIRSYPAFPAPSSTYVNDPRFQPFMPMFISSPHGFVPQQGLSTYLGNIGLISSPNGNGSSPVHSSSSSNMGVSGSRGLGQFIPSFVPSYPERPDLPECRYFMNSGTCKYGLDCRYNHPKERASQMLPEPASPLGLPLRPVQPQCSNFDPYGFCKSRPVCNFHHQVVGGYPLNFGFSPLPFLPVPIPILDPSLFMRNSSTVVISSDSSSPSKLPKYLDSASKDQNLDTNGQHKSHEAEAVTPTNSSMASTVEHHD